MKSNFWRAGHTPTLLAAFLYFDLSFMVWYLLGPLQIQIATALNLTTQERGLVVATPILAGALLRLVLGILVDQIGPKRTGLIAQVIVMLAMLAAWRLGIHSLNEALLLGLFLGFAGAAFAVALPLASRWYPPEHQGTAMGIAGAGNSGTVLAALFAPMLALAVGWTNVFGVMLIPLILVFCLYCMMAKDAPGAATPKKWQSYIEVLAQRDAWLFMGFYAITFGGFAGFASALPGYFHDQFNFTPQVAGWYTAACVLAGSVMRPLGGVIADRIGGTRTLLMVYIACSILIGLVGLGWGGSTVALSLFIAAMLCLGAGNGAVFQLVPQRFNQDLGVMTGLIGMAGGVGGFFLAAGLGVVKQGTGSYALGLWLFSVLALGAWYGLSEVKVRWRSSMGLAQARI
ncbi:nitrate/nitrite transporter [Deefgea salmonis]|uniref:NarK/NasA family nitrate transporter n=1 Tax=Deefgea salmonis TaxID=2875502 RepID=A0ABS8BNV3_9NEIS|nr:nitrate/nitrite transporter [Deefgea salmonis]MCB5197221.1 NarK/NasA family nitrate transporter [Deefgea salmonis]